jgi:hypothetical protein
MSVRFRVRTLLLVVVLAAGMLAVPSCLVAAWQTLQDTTYYAPGYSEWNFRSIRPGMPESEVIRLLGQPLQAHGVEPRITWYYGPPTLRVSDDGGLWDASGTFDTGRGYTVITADQGRRVVQASGGFLRINPDDLVGQTLSDVRKRYDEPRAVREQPSSKYLVYSGTKVSGSYYTRGIGQDASGRVNSIIAGWSQD